MSEENKPADKPADKSDKPSGGRSKNRRGGRRRSGNKKNNPNANPAAADADGNKKADSDKPSGGGNRNNNRGSKPAGKGPGDGRSPSQKPSRGGKKRRPNQGKGQQNRSGSKKSKAKAEPKLDIGPQKTSVKIVESEDQKKYGVVFYDNLQTARFAIEDIQLKSREVDQLNIVIKAEAEMNDPDLIQYGILYAGEAWHLIHTRRMEDGWYN